MTVPEQFSGRVVAHRYHLGARRGSGVDAAQFDAFDAVDQRPVTLKVVHPELSADPDFQRRFFEIMGVATSLLNPNIAITYASGSDAWNESPVLYVASEYLSGGTLRDLSDRGRLLDPSQALAIGLDACKALDAIHRAGLVHGDVRPSTLAFGDDRRLRLIDVGLAGLLAQQLWEDPSLVRNDRAMYASPERAVGHPETAKGDVYSLCLTLLEAVTGQLPFVGDSAVATLSNRVDRLLPVSADLGSLAAVLEHAGRPHAEDRQTAAEFGRALMQTAEKLPRPAPIQLLSGGLFGDSTGPIVRPPDDATAVLARPPASVVNASSFAAEPVSPTPPAAPPLPVVAAAPLAPPTLTAPVEGAPLSSAPLAAMPVDIGGPITRPEAPASGVYPPAATARRRRRRRWPWIVATLALLFAAGAAVTYFVTKTSSHEVPNLVGVDQDAALNQISAFKWSPLITREASETVPLGQVIRTEPADGSSLQEGKELQLVVSTGAAPRALPEINGLTKDDAAAALAAVGLKISDGPAAFDDTVAPGIVLSWSVPAQPLLKAGATVTPGTTVEVIVSQGPAPRVVPNLVGLSLADATAALQQLGLVAAQSPDVFSDLPVGAVISQDPPADSSVPRGTTVTVALSAGLEPVAFPPVGNLSLADATSVLQAAGFVVGEVVGSPDGPVVLAEINGVGVAPGAQFPPGSVVRLTLADVAPPPGT